MTCDHTFQLTTTSAGVCLGTYLNRRFDASAFTSAVTLIIIALGGLKGTTTGDTLLKFEEILVNLTARGDTRGKDQCGRNRISIGPFQMV